jgi:hypothetical protein
VSLLLAGATADSKNIHQTVPSSLALKNERPVLLTKQVSNVPNPQLEGEWQICYATLHPDSQHKLKVTLVKEDIIKGVSHTQEFTFLSSLGQDNYYYIFDPMFIGQGTYLMKFGRAEGTTDSYKVVTYKEGEKESRILINNELRNRFLQVSPDGSYVAYIVGGSYSGSEPTYFPASLELWVCEISTGNKRRLAHGNALDNAYRWRDNKTLVFYNASSPKVAPQSTPNKESFVESTISEYDVLTQTTKIVWRMKGVPWHKDEMIKAIQVVAHSHKTSLKDNGLLLCKAKQDNLKFQRFERASLSSVGDTISFYVGANKPEALIGTSKDEFALQFEQWLFSVNKEQSLLKSERDLRVITYKYHPSLKRVAAMPNSDIVALKTFEAARSPVTQQPEIAFPRKSFSLLQVNGQEAKIVWQKENVFGLTVTPPNGMPETLNY